MSGFRQHTVPQMIAWRGESNGPWSWRVPGVRPLPRPWCSLGCGRVGTSFFKDRGFGLVAVEELAAGTDLARGLIEVDYCEESYAISEGGTMYGPAARVNAACSEQCANARFTKCNGTWTVWAKRTIAAGKEVVVFYRATGGRCGVCGRVF